MRNLCGDTAKLSMNKRDEEEPCWRRAKRSPPSRIHPFTCSLTQPATATPSSFIPLLPTSSPHLPIASLSTELSPNSSEVATQSLGCQFGIAGLQDISINLSQHQDSAHATPLTPSIHAARERGIRQSQNTETRCWKYCRYALCLK